MGTVSIQSNKSQPLPDSLLNPRGSDLRFREQQTVFLASGFSLVLGSNPDKVEGANYIYADRLNIEYYDQQVAAWEAAKEQGHEVNSPAMFEAILRILFDKPKLELVHMITGVIFSSGNSFRAYGFFPDGAPEVKPPEVPPNRSALQPPWTYTGV